MHPPGTRSLHTGSARQATPQLHERTGHLVAHGGLALVMVHRRGSRMSVAGVSSARCLCGGGSGSNGVSACSALGAHDACLEGRACSGACCAC
jgi:hypothetical protein